MGSAWTCPTPSSDGEGGVPGRAPGPVVGREDELDEGGRCGMECCRLTADQRHGSHQYLGQIRLAIGERMVGRHAHQTFDLHGMVAARERRGNGRIACRLRPDGVDFPERKKAHIQKKVDGKNCDQPAAHGQRILSKPCCRLDHGRGTHRHVLSPRWPVAGLVGRPHLQSRAMSRRCRLILNRMTLHKKVDALPCR